MARASETPTHASQETCSVVPESDDVQQSLELLDRVLLEFEDPCRASEPPPPPEEAARLISAIMSSPRGSPGHSLQRRTPPEPGGSPSQSSAATQTTLPKARHTGGKKLGSQFGSLPYDLSSHAAPQPPPPWLVRRRSRGEVSSSSTNGTGARTQLHLPIQNPLTTSMGGAPASDSASSEEEEQQFSDDSLEGQVSSSDRDADFRDLGSTNSREELATSALQQEPQDSTNEARQRGSIAWDIPIDWDLDQAVVASKKHRKEETSKGVSRSQPQTPSCPPPPISTSLSGGGTYVIRERRKRPALEDAFLYVPVIPLSSTFTSGVSLQQQQQELRSSGKALGRSLPVLPHKPSGITHVPEPSTSDMNFQCNNISCPVKAEAENTPQAVKVKPNNHASHIQDVLENPDISEITFKILRPKKIRPNSMPPNEDSIVVFKSTVQLGDNKKKRPISVHPIVVEKCNSTKPNDLPKTDELLATESKPVDPCTRSNESKSVDPCTRSNESKSVDPCTRPKSAHFHSVSQVVLPARPLSCAGLPNEVPNVLCLPSDAPNSEQNQSGESLGEIQNLSSADLPTCQQNLPSDPELSDTSQQNLPPSLEISAESDPPTSQQNLPQPPELPADPLISQQDLIATPEPPANADQSSSQQNLPELSADADPPVSQQNLLTKPEVSSNTDLHNLQQTIPDISPVEMHILHTAPSSKISADPLILQQNLPEPPANADPSSQQILPAPPPNTDPCSEKNLPESPANADPNSQQNLLKLPTNTDHLAEQNLPDVPPVEIQSSPELPAEDLPPPPSALELESAEILAEMADKVEVPITVSSLVQTDITLGKRHKLSLESPSEEQVVPSLGGFHTLPTPDDPLPSRAIVFSSTALSGESLSCLENDMEPEMHDAMDPKCQSNNDELVTTVVIERNDEDCSTVLEPSIKRPPDLFTCRAWDQKLSRDSQRRKSHGSSLEVTCRDTEKRLSAPESSFLFPQGHYTIPLSFAVTNKPPSRAQEKEEAATQEPVPTEPVYKSVKKKSNKHHSAMPPPLPPHQNLTPLEDDYAEPRNIPDFGSKRNQVKPSRPRQLTPHKDQQPPPPPPHQTLMFEPEKPLPPTPDTPVHNVQLSIVEDFDCHPLPPSPTTRPLPLSATFPVPPSPSLLHKAQGRRLTPPSPSLPRGPYPLPASPDDAVECRPRRPLPSPPESDYGFTREPGTTGLGSLKTRSVDAGLGRGLREQLATSMNHTREVAGDRMTLPMELSGVTPRRHAVPPPHSTGVRNTKKKGRAPTVPPHASLPETPVFTRGCDIPRAPYRPPAVGIPVLRSSLSEEGDRLVLCGPARGWYPKQRHNKSARSTENLDQASSLWGEPRKPQTLPPNLNPPKFFHRSPREALRRVTSLLIRRGASSNKEPRSSKDVVSPNGASGSQCETPQRQKRSFFRSFWKKSKHYSLEQ